GAASAAGRGTPLTVPQRGQRALPPARPSFTLSARPQREQVKTSSGVVTAIAPLNRADEPRGRATARKDTVRGPAPATSGGAAATSGVRPGGIVPPRWGDCKGTRPGKCPGCGQSAGYHGDRGRTPLSPLGPVPLTRAYYYCRRCGRGFCPFDRDAGL